MTTRNDITGDIIQTRPTTKKYRDNFDDIKWHDDDGPEQVKYYRPACPDEKNYVWVDPPGKATVREAQLEAVQRPQIIYVDEIVDTWPYIAGVLQPKQEGTTYIVRNAKTK